MCGDDGTYAFELELPRNTSDGAAITAAVAMKHALDRWRASELATAELLAEAV